MIEYKINLLNTSKWIGLWFGAGLSPRAPGTVGTLAALPFAWLIQASLGNTALLLAAMVLFPIGWWACAVYIKATGKQDPSELVVDEVVAQWLVLAFLPPTLMGYFVGFTLFRFFDVLKPWPISWVDRTVKGGLGVMLDDVVAALGAIILGWGVMHYVPSTSL